MHRQFHKLIIVLCLATCKSPEKPYKEETVHTQNKYESLPFVYGLFTGRKLKFSPGSYDRSGTRVVYLDRHNDAWSDATIDSILAKSSILAVDSASLKTITVLIKNINRYPLSKFLDSVDSKDSSDFFIFYVNIPILAVKKIVSYKDTGDYKLRLANKIIETY